jgi:hypothetical protein
MDLSCFIFAESIKPKKAVSQHKSNVYFKIIQDLKVIIVLFFYKSTGQAYSKRVSLIMYMLLHERN